MSMLWRVCRWRGLPYQELLAMQTLVRERVRDKLASEEFDCLMKEVSENEQMAAMEVLALEMEVAKLREALTDITATLA